MNNYILHIETSTTICSVALSKNGELLKVQESDNSHYTHGEQLTIFIEEVLKTAHIHPNQLVAVSVSAGPGSYTGLRIGTSTAKGLCYALDIPLIALSSLQNLAFIARQKYDNMTICPLIDARRMEVFSAVYNSDGEQIKAESADILDEHSYKEFGSFLAVGNGAKKMEEPWKNRPITFASEITLSASGHPALVYQKFHDQLFEDTAYFEPHYLKEWQGSTKKQ